MSDYTAREAARVIGRSERLVRRLAETGRLQVTSTNPLRVSAESVHRERSKRKTKPEQSAGISAEQAQAIATAAATETVRAVLPLMLEARDQAEARIVADLAQAKQEIERLRRELETERTKPALKLPPVGWPFRR